MAFIILYNHSLVQFASFSHFCCLEFITRMHQCELKVNQHLKTEFEKEYLKMDNALLRLKLSKPALRALLRLNIYKLEDLCKIRLNELENAHGIGPSGIEKLKVYLKK